jgi:ATP diphosphatase
MSNNKHPIEDLIAVMRALRNPDGGCPWDLEQDFKTIAPYTIEEAYEVADAIDRDDMRDLREELGDLLLQPIYHAQMASEENAFDIYDVMRDITNKMISRHPHVFGDEKAKSAEDVNAIWDQRKKAEKKEAASALDGVTLALPALLRAQKLQSKAAKVGFEWQDANGVLDKLEEELKEMREALKSGTLEQKADELGDLLFVLVNLGRMMGLNAEEALRQCNNKFERRFRGMEQDIKDSGSDLPSSTLSHMEEIWKAQKLKERKA